MKQVANLFVRKGIFIGGTRFAFSSFGKFPFLAQLGLSAQNTGAYYDGKWQVTDSSSTLKSVNPVTEEVIATTKCATVKDYEKTLAGMQVANKEWRSLPMPVRGDIVRQIGEAFRVNKDALGRTISLEMGKIYSEGQGEVQEAIDICDMACGLSRTIGGQVFNSERPEHFMMEVWNPLGTVGVISAFNFPNAVFGWNLAIALMCGNSVVWKGAPASSLTTIATSKVIADVFKKNKINPNVFTVLQGNSDIGESMAKDKRVNLLSFTGSTKVGRQVRGVVEARFGKMLLELGGNNAAIVMPDANLDIALKSSVFGAVGTCGQRCTSLRRLYIHESIFDSFVDKMVKAYSTIKIGDPLEESTLCGPLNNQGSVDTYLKTIETVKKEGGKVLYGGKRIDRKGFFVEPTIVHAPQNAPYLQQEYFCPILFLQKFSTLDEAIEMNNNQPYGLSSSLFTKDITNAMKWVGPNGSDCGIVNVNIGTSGAEIGGAFGGEKATGGGREAGSDAWKQYMKRQTCTLNHGATLPLAQGVNFDV